MADDKELFGLKAPEFSGEVSPEDIKEVSDAMLPPNGTYKTDPEEFGAMTLRPDFDQNDDTRRIVTITGRVKGTFKAENGGSPREVTTFLRDKSFRISPDKRKGVVWIVGEDGKRIPTEERTAKFDGMTNRWIQGAKVFMKEYGKPPKEQELLDFFQTGEYKVVLSNLNGNIYVTQIAPLRGRI